MSQDLVPHASGNKLKRDSAGQVPVRLIDRRRRGEKTSIDTFTLEFGALLSPIRDELTDSHLLELARRKPPVKVATIHRMIALYASKKLTVPISVRRLRAIANELEFQNLTQQGRKND